DVATRDWPMSHVPVILSEREWQELSTGLIQRAELLEAVMADVYGDNTLVRNGSLPGALLASNPHWLRPLVGVPPRDGHYLHFIAMELGRGPDGGWWVLGDRTEAPSGAGFALETRVATARVFAEIYRQSNVHRLAGFFGAFKDALARLQQGTSGRIGLLTPGPFNETYYEQAYIARYLGLALLEGEDLVVEGKELMVRTIAGPRPVSVLWRRLESAWCDPLELDERSRLGTPGLVDAVRAGTLTMVNALGAGVLETQAFLAFLPRLCQRLRGEKLKVPNVATWWCGQEAEYEHVRRNADRLVISAVTANRLPLETDQTTRKSPEEREAWLARERNNLVGQEAVKLSTTPVWHEGKLVPRPVTLRVFLARTPQGWQVMPGGFARVGQGSDQAGIAMRHGASVADVWVVSNHAVPEPSLLKRDGAGFLRASPGILPSRAADNLYWLGRYVERTEGTLRLLRAYHGRLAETGDTEAPLVKRVEEIFTAYGMSLERPLPDQVAGCVDAAVGSASKIRDRFSLDGWAALVDLAASVHRMSGSVSAGDDAARAISVLIRKLTGFSGLVNDNMYRAMGWRFLTIGQALERAVNMVDLIAALTDPEAPDGALDLLIEVGDSVMTHRRRYAMVTRESVCDLLALDALNPRSVLFELDRIQEHANALPGTREGQQLGVLARALLKLRTDIATAEAGSIAPGWLREIRNRIAGLSDIITDTYLA
ncbi:MAG: circularly permuted type 2 ATP-grasp protein, partial [Proteobacteria bacterium]|nr:circularly permuted type 2 ATP-grasp protein [Pseudomonadota bacterium]